jgi:hypothetical protein
MSVNVSNSWVTMTTTEATEGSITFDSVATNFTLSLPKMGLRGDSKSEEIFPNYVTWEQLVFYLRKNQDYDNNNSNQGPGYLEFVNVKELLARFFVGTYFQVAKVKNWRSQCIGITSMMQPAHESYGGPHMPMFDYDGNVKKKIKKDVATFQDKYGLGDAWVYKTKKGYHVYFFCDQVSYEIYMQMLKEADCCKGFRDRSLKRRFAVLRVSAKYTKFDIELEYILKSKNTSVVKRPLRKALIIQELLSLGQQCGTHFASLFPQWARFKEDIKEWRSPPKPKTRKVRKKSDKGSYTKDQIIHMKKEMLYKEMYEASVFPPKQQDASNLAGFDQATIEAKLNNQAPQGFVSTNKESIYYKESKYHPDNQEPQASSSATSLLNGDQLIMRAPFAKYVTDEDEYVEDEDWGNEEY